MALEQVRQWGHRSIPGCVLLRVVRQRIYPADGKLTDADFCRL